jgi:Ca2+-binding EF-hand superfamily protein
MSFKITTLILPAAAVAIAIAVPAAVDAQRGQGRGQARGQAEIRFQGMDTNGDGTISRQEWRGNDRSFANHDWNNDGQLSGAEVRPGAQRNANWEEADHIPNRYERYNSWTQAGFNNLDHNRDRKIADNEWHFDRETFRRVDRNRDGALDQNEFLGGDVDDARADNFDELDWNNNGRVERSEWYGTPAIFNSMDRNNDGVLSRFEVVGGVDTPNDTWDQFVSLDYNRNGNISRDEWHWSAASFARYDTNRDNMLSRQEFSAGGGSPAAGGTAQQRTVTVRVNSAQRWTDSGIAVRAGDVLTFNVTGNIQLSDDSNDRAGVAGSVNNRRAPDAPVLNQLAGGLIANIDNYGPIFIGGRRTFTVPVNGRLYLGVNDDHLADNRGEFIVNLTVAPR